MPSHRRKASLRAALLAGLIAIVINTILLYLADFIPLQTAHGGLLNLLKLVFGSTLVKLGVADAWNASNLPGPGDAVFKTTFHILVGLGMAVVYAFVVEPILTGSVWIKGLAYATLLWLINSFLILPLIGEGIAGSHHLDVAGIVYYAGAHTAFFLLLAWLYDRLLPAQTQSTSEYL